MITRTYNKFCVSMSNNSAAGVCHHYAVKSIYRLFFEIASIQKYVCLKKPAEMTCCLVLKKRMLGFLQKYFIHMGRKLVPCSQGHRYLARIIHQKTAQTEVALELNLQQLKLSSLRIWQA